MFIKLFKKNILLAIFIIPFLSSCLNNDSSNENQFDDLNVLKPITKNISAKKGVLPKNYMMEKYGKTEPFYCDFKDPIEEIACMAWDESLGSTLFYLSKGEVTYDPQRFNLIVALSSMNKIQQDISGSRNYLYFMNGFNKLESDDSLLQKRGSCGNHQLIFSLVMDLLGIPNRRVSVYMELDGERLSHAMNEVMIENQWVLFDVTNGALYLDKSSFVQNQVPRFLSFEGLLDIPQYKRFKSRRYNLNDIKAFNNSLGFEGISKNFQNSIIREQFAYLIEETKFLAVLYDDEGDITVELGKEKKNVFAQLPNYIGTNKVSKNGTRMRFVWSGPIEKLDLNLYLSGVGGCTSSGPILINDRGKEYPIDKLKKQISVKNGEFFRVKRDIGEICYVVLERIEVLK